MKTWISLLPEAVLNVREVSFSLSAPTFLGISTFTAAKSVRSDCKKSEIEWGNQWNCPESWSQPRSCVISNYTSGLSGIKFLQDGLVCIQYFNIKEKMLLNNSYLATWVVFWSVVVVLGHRIVLRIWWCWMIYWEARWQRIKPLSLWKSGYRPRPNAWHNRKSFQKRSWCLWKPQLSSVSLV